MSTVVARVQGIAARATEWWKDSRAGRTVAWYGARNGTLLCGGIAYSALFSISAGLTIGYTVFVTVLGTRTDLRDAVLGQVDAWIPGLVDTGDGGVLEPGDLVLRTALNVAGIVAAVVLLFSAIGFMGALRTSVRAMFDAPVIGTNPVLAKVWQLVGFVLLGVGVLASAAASIASKAVGRFVEELFGGAAVVAALVGVGAAAVGVVLDAVVVALIIVLVARVRPRTRDLVIGCLAAGVVAGALRWLGTSVIVGSAQRNALLASFAVIGTLLVLVNFVARVLLLVCAWMHDPARLDEVQHAEEELHARRHAEEVERLVRLGAGEGKLWSPVVRGIRRARLRWTTPPG